MAAVRGATYLDKAGDKAGAARRKDGEKAGREGGGEKERERTERQEGGAPRVAGTQQAALEERTEERRGGKEAERRGGRERSGRRARGWLR